MQALGLAGDARDIPVIRPYYENYLKAMEAEAVTGVPADVFFGSVPDHAFWQLQAIFSRLLTQKSMSRPSANTVTIPMSKFATGPNTHWKMKARRRSRGRRST